MTTDISYKPSNDGPRGAPLSLETLFTAMYLGRQPVFDTGLRVVLPYGREGISM